MLPAEAEIHQDGSTVICQINRSDVTHLDLQEVVDDCVGRMRNDNARQFILDLTRVEFLASACIGVLVGFLQDLEPMRGRIMLAGCQDNVKFLFKVTQLDTVFPIYDDVSEALAAN